MSAVSLAVGVLFGLLPIYGLQVITLLGVSIVFRMSKLLAMLGVSISSAPFLPFWIAAGIGVGKLMVPDKALVSLGTGPGSAIPPAIAQWISSGSPGASIAVAGVQWFVGSIVIAIVCALVTFAVAYPLFMGLSKLRSKLKSSGNTASAQIVDAPGSDR
jgi:uncharacterized protein (DUF2062 family)